MKSFYFLNSVLNFPMKIQVWPDIISKQALGKNILKNISIHVGDRSK